LQKTHLTKDGFPKYTKSSQNSTIKKQPNFKMGKRVNRHVTKEDLKMTNTRKDIQRLMSVENCKLKQATTTI
jgi:hypothetical protein